MSSRVGLDASEKNVLPLSGIERRQSSPYPVVLPTELSRLLKCKTISVLNCVIKHYAMKAWTYWTGCGVGPRISCSYRISKLSRWSRSLVTVPTELFIAYSLYFSLILLRLYAAVSFRYNEMSTFSFLKNEIIDWITIKEIVLNVFFLGVCPLEEMSKWRHNGKFAHVRQRAALLMNVVGFVELILFNQMTRL